MTNKTIAIRKLIKNTLIVYEDYVVPFLPTDLKENSNKIHTQELPFFKITHQNNFEEKALGIIWDNGRPG